MNSKKIPLSKISDQSHNGVVYRRISTGEQVVKIEYTHQDNYFIFIFLETGIYKASIDFTDYKLAHSSLLFISPGQVHSNIDYVNVSGWLLAVDPSIINKEYLAIFNRIKSSDIIASVNDRESDELKKCLFILSNKIESGQTPLEQTLIHSLISSYLGLFASAYASKVNSTENKRSASISYEFKKLLNSNYKTMKSPKQYAGLLNYSPSYLNEVIKEHTGFSVSQSIHNEVILQAKRLLFHTDLSIKEIALELGYSDYAYFTRLFTQVAEIPPTQFRLNYRK